MFDLPLSNLREIAKDNIHNAKCHKGNQHVTVIGDCDAADFAIPRHLVKGGPINTHTSKLGQK